MHGVVSSGPPLCSLDLAAFWKPELGDVAAQLIFPGLVPRLRFRGEDGDPFSQLALPWIREVSAEGGGREEVSLGRRIAAHHTVDDAWWIGRMVQGEASIGADVRRCEGPAL